MNLIPRNVHGVIDYVFAAILISAPWLAGFADDLLATRVMVSIGLAQIGYSLFTNYPLGLVLWIPFSIHLLLDAATCLILIISPWLSQFSGRVWWPHAAAGAVGFCVGILSWDRARAKRPVYKPIDDHA